MVVGPSAPFLWILKGAVATGAASGVAVAGWHELQQWCGAELPVRTRARVHRRTQHTSGRRGPSPRGKRLDPDEESSDDDSDADDAEKAVTTQVVQGVLWGGAAGYAIAASLAMPMLHLSWFGAVSGALAAALFMSPVWIVAGGMRSQHIARNLPSYSSRLVLMSGTVVLCLGPAMYVWGSAVLKLKTVHHLKHLGAKAVNKLGVNKVKKKVIALVSGGKYHGFNTDVTLAVVSGVRVVTYGHAASGMWHFANRYPVVMRAKTLRDGATRGERWLNELAIVLTQVVGNCVAACWMASALLDAPGKIQSDWLMLWPPYIWSYTILVHLQAPSDDHDFSRGVQMWRMTWFGVACCSVLPDFSSVHVQAIENFLATAGYAAWLGTFNGEWQRLCAPPETTERPHMVLANPELWLVQRKERQERLHEAAAQVDGWSNSGSPTPVPVRLPAGSKCAKSGRTIGGQELCEQVCFLRPNDGAPLHFEVVTSVPTLPHIVTKIRRYPVRPKTVEVTAKGLREVAVIDGCGEVRVVCGPSSPRRAKILSGCEGEVRSIVSVDGKAVRTAADVESACDGVSDDHTLQVVLSHCSVDTDAPHPADVAILRSGMHRLAAAAGIPTSWDPKAGRWTYEVPRWKFFRVPGDTGGVC
eukprot:TRINITY_DN1731_c6_g1_i1.p1 TRINITY_DN1731_c6_g1~~TRINITY_DN1731_c6_g1_i1.p1  ORF type:complete len:642 (+),score=95.14 TRINITY_DN1731_c6_g1_i1:96-2021(+)